MVNIVELRGKAWGYGCETGEYDSGVKEEYASFFFEAYLESSKRIWESDWLLRGMRPEDVRVWRIGSFRSLVHLKEGPVESRRWN